MSTYLHGFRPFSPYIRPEFASPQLRQLMEQLAGPSLPGDDFARLGPGLASALPFVSPSQPLAPTTPLGQDLAVIRQQLHTLELMGQHLAGAAGAPAPAQLNEQQAAELLQLLLWFLMTGGQLPGQTGAPGSGGGGFQPNALAPGRFVGVPTQGGRDLGSLGAAGSTLPAGPSGAAGGITADQLRQVAPNLSASRAAELTPHLNNAMAEGGITTRRQQAAFIAQLAQESGGFKWFEELASGAAYEGRRDLGNTQPGDGRRFKGRGPIQLTGRANYRAAGRALGLDLENNPELVSRPDVGFRVAAWYWKSRGLNDLAEAGNFREVTRRINGGYNGLAVREQYYRRALQVV